MKFFGIRYFNISDSQISFLESSSPGDLFLSPFRNKDRIESYNKIYTARILYDEDERYLLGYIFKSKDTHLISLDEKNIKDIDISERDILNWEKLYFIIDTKKQILACEYNPYVARPSAIKNRLMDLAGKYYEKSGYSLKLEFLREKKTFWGLIKGSEELYEISFTLNAPNLFGLSKEANGFLKQVKDVFNIDSLNVGFKNSNGSLSYDEEEIEPLRDYVDDGGGKWRVKNKKDGKKRTHSSDSYFSTKEAEVEEDVDAPLVNRIKEIKDSLKQIVIMLDNESSN